MSDTPTDHRATAPADRLAAAVRRYRKANRLTLEQVCERAQAAGLALGATELSRVERGRLQWNSARLNAVATALGLELTLSATAGAV